MGENIEVKPLAYAFNIENREIVGNPLYTTKGERTGSSTSEDTRGSETPQIKGDYILKNK